MKKPDSPENLAILGHIPTGLNNQLEPRSTCSLYLFLFVLILFKSKLADIYCNDASRRI